MRKNVWGFTILTLLTIMTFASLEARPGGGGGGGRASGRSGGAIQRSPSMSRATRPPPASKPHVNRQNISTHAPSVQRSPIKTNSPVSSANRSKQTNSQIQQYMKNKPITRTESANKSPAARDQGKYKNLGTNVKSMIKSEYPNRNKWFKQDFWDKHNDRPPYYSHNGNWWAKATALGVGSWLGWRNQPYYYDSYDDFGYAGGYYYDDAYSDSSSNQSNDSQETEPFASGSGQTNQEWMPLGVFSITKNQDTAAAPNMFIQLALSKEGVIAGTFYNATTDQTQELEGWVDPESQRAAWKVANRSDSPLIETGIYNLTQGEAPARIYFPNGTSQDRLLVRLDS